MRAHLGATRGSQASTTAGRAIVGQALPLEPLRERVGGHHPALSRKRNRGWNCFLSSGRSYAEGFGKILLSLSIHSWSLYLGQGRPTSVIPGVDS